MTDKRPTIALLMDHFLGDYQTVLRDAVEMTAKEQGVDFLCVIGRAIDSPHAYERVQNDIFQSITARSVDGVIIISSSLSLYTGKDALSEFCRGYDPLPVCSIGLRIPGVPSVIVDNTRISQTILHLAQDHGCRKFAFIGGPAANEEAVIRRNAVVNKLNELGFPLAPGMEDSGKFTLQSGCEATVRILAQNTPFDALVVANDTMALGALSVLKKNGIDVPGDVKVTGFDDTPAGRFYSPRLSTMRQRLEEIGRHAVELVLKQRRGETPPIVLEVAPRLVRRQSCGCTRRFSSVETLISLTGESLTDFLDTKRQALTALLVGNVQIPELSFSRWASRLVDALIGEVGGRKGQFIIFLREFLAAADYRQWVIDELQNAISVLREQFVSFERDEALDLGSLWYEAQLLLMDASAQGHMKSQMAGDLASALFLRPTAADLPALLTDEALVQAISDELGTIGIENGLVSAFSKRDPDRLECIAAVRDGVPVSFERAPYDTQIIVPPFLEQDRRMSYVAIPLSSGTERLGIMVLELGAADLYYEILREHMSAYLKNIPGSA
jgi:sigma-B regulation protein RsbU (phosphoserine phosphatase)